MGLFCACAGVVPKIRAQNEEHVQKVCEKDDDCNPLCAFRNCPGLVNKCFGDWCVCCENPPSSSSADNVNLIN